MTAILALRWVKPPPGASFAKPRNNKNISPQAANDMTYKKVCQPLRDDGDSKNGFLGMHPAYAKHRLLPGLTALFREEHIINNGAGPHGPMRQIIIVFVKF